MAIVDPLPLLWLLVWLGAVIAAWLVYGYWASVRARKARAKHFEESKTFRWGNTGAK